MSRGHQLYPVPCYAARVGREVVRKEMVRAIRSGQWPSLAAAWLHFEAKGTDRSGSLAFAALTLLDRALVVSGNQQKTIDQQRLSAVFFVDSWGQKVL